MNKKLFLIKNPDSPYIDYFADDFTNNRIVLIQNGVFSTDLKEKGAGSLKSDAIARGIDSEGSIDYDQLLDEIVASDTTVII